MPRSTVDDRDLSADSSPAARVPSGQAELPLTWLASLPPRSRRLLAIAVAVVAVDWLSKALAWRFLPGDAVINPDTSGALPLLPGVLSQPLLGAIVDGAVLVLLAVIGGWLARTVSLGTLAWAGFALVWAGAGSNALDRWFGHLWLAPGSQRGVVDWIGVQPVGAINLADCAIGVGALVAIAGLALSRMPVRALAAISAGVILLVPVSMLTTDGALNNAPPEPVAPTFQQQVRSMMWVGSESHGRRALYRDQSSAMRWAMTVQAVDRTGLVLAQWHFSWNSDVALVMLPEQTSAVLVRPDGRDWVMTLADNLS